MLRSERGAVMITAIFMTLFLVAMLYVLIGVGKTLMLREGMQDAADAAAYSSAIFNARGMNLIVFINLLMAALVAVLVAIRVAQTLLFMGAGIATAALWTTGGASAPIAAELTRAGHNMGNVFKKTKKVVGPILEGLHTTQEAVSVVVPWAAMTSGMTEAARHHAPAEGAVAIPGSISLPVEADEFSTLCGRATETAMSVVLMPLPDSAERFAAPLERAAQKFGEKTSKFLCGDGSSAPPTHTEQIEREFPRHPQEAECGDDAESSACRQIARDLEDAKPNEHTGECLRHCGYDDPYEALAREARHACEPMPGYPLKKFRWQEREVHARFTFDGAQWTETSRQVERSKLKTNFVPPCGYRGSVNEDEYNRDSGPREASKPNPVCVSVIEELNDSPAPNTVRSVEFTEVQRIFSCVLEDSRTYTTADQADAMGGEGSEKKSPHRVEKGVSLGDEALQIRAVAWGDMPGPGKTATAGVQVAIHGRESAPSVGGKLTELGAQLGRFSVAQAEYYFDHQGQASAEDLMWEMKWTARLRHFRLPDEEEQREQEERRRKNSSDVSQKVTRFGGLDPDHSPADACRKQGGSCGGAVGSISLFDSIVRH